MGYVKQSSSRQGFNEGASVADVDSEGTQVMAAIRSITGRGNDAEVRKKRDGTLAVYEIKRNIVSAR